MTSNTPYKLQALDIHKRYGQNEVLKGVSLSARAGDVISIIGSSGSGKSTFLRCINLLEQPQQGRIIVADEELQLRPGRDGALAAADQRQLQRLRTRLAMVFQHFNLWAHMTVMQNIIEVPVHVLGISKDDKSADREEFLARLEGKTLPAPARKRIDEELNKLSILETGSPEYAVTRNYLDWATALPWGIHGQDKLDLGRARRRQGTRTDRAGHRRTGAEDGAGDPRPARHLAAR